MSVHSGLLAWRRGSGGRGSPTPADAAERTSRVSTAQASCTASAELGVSNQIWEKKGPLSTAEWERVRMYPYLTGRILSRVGGLESVVSARDQARGTDRRVRLSPRARRRGVDRTGPAARRGGGLSPTARAASASAGARSSRCCRSAAPRGARRTPRRRVGGGRVGGGAGIGHRGGRPGRRGSPPGRSRFCDWSRRAGRTVKSPPSCSSQRRRRATTSSASTPSWASTTARRRVSRPSIGVWQALRSTRPRDHEEPQ